MPGPQPTPTVDFGASTVLGYPRIGPGRELKWALEAYWAGRAGADDLMAEGRRLRAASWRRLAATGLAAVPSHTFSYYDHVLDAAVLVDAVPDRFRAAGGPLEAYFAMARGTDDLPPLRMTKWFDTNYHYLVPEIGESTALRLAGDGPVAEVREARALGLATRPVLLGPVTLLLLSRSAPGGRPGFSPLDRLPDLLAVYADLLTALADAGAGWVQLDEPALVADRTPAELDAVASAYRYLGALTRRPRLFVASYFGELGPALPVLAGTPVDAIGLDLVRGRSVLSEVGHDGLEALGDKTIVAGVVSGRDVWRTDVDDALAVLRHVRARVGRVVVATSCSLLHVPYDLDAERDLDPALRERLAFADQKVAEVVTLADLLAEPPSRPSPTAGRRLGPGPGVAWTEERSDRSDEGRRRLQGTGPRASEASANKRSPYAVRAAAQAASLGLPALPVTTIGSFPQTGALRAARAALSRGKLEVTEYEERVRAEIRHVIEVQERLGLDVLVHGEPERNDMVQYFAEHLDGFATTRHGWVQSYGSRCTRPPILHGDVTRPAPITVGWSTYAQSLTSRPVKGMLTGPVTIVAWSFVRRDIPLPEVILQVAAAIRGEVSDLEAAGIAIIQVDEPALRELLPLRRAGQAEYLDAAVGAYRLATSGAGDRTQIHTHLCYSDADQIIEAIDALDADVTSIESARSGARVLAEPSIAGYPRGLGPGVYDIHSPRVPSEDEVAGRLAAAARVVPARRLWVNPDCGLKTRGYDEVLASLTNVVSAARRVRGEV